MRKLIWTAVAAGVITACAQPPARPDAAATAKDARHCLQETGSRIRPAAGGCVNEPGRVVTREEIERTGSFTTFDALRNTVPELR